MATRTMQEALRAAAIAKALRKAEMGDARECRGDFETAREHRLPQEVCDRYRERVRAHVARARKWNRQLVIAQRAIRAAMFARRVRHRGWRLARAAQAVRP